MQLVALEYLQSIEGAGRICWSAPFCGEVLLICTHQGSPFRGGFGMRIPMASPMRGRRHGGAVTDEVAANLIRPLSQPLAASSPERGAFWGASCRSRAPPLQSAEQIKITSPQKGADQQIWSAPSIFSKYSKAASCKFGTPVSGGAYKDASKVIPEWNDA